jgi:hypothetical protein
MAHLHNALLCKSYACKKVATTSVITADSLQESDPKHERHFNFTNFLEDSLGCRDTGIY